MRNIFFPHYLSGEPVFPPIEKLYGVKLVIPENSEFCTAIGAALCYYDERFKMKV